MIESTPEEGQIDNSRWLNPLQDDRIDPLMEIEKSHDNLNQHGTIAVVNNFHRTS